MSQETTQPSPIDINPSDIRLDPLQQRLTLGQGQVNPYFHQQQLRPQQPQPSGMFILQQPVNSQFYGMNNFEDLLSQQALNQNFEAMGFVDNNNNNNPYQNYPVQYPYDFQNLNLNHNHNNNNNSQNNNNPQYINIANNNNHRNNVPQQFFQLNDRQVDSMQFINPQRQQTHSNHNYINNKDKNNGNNDKRNHRSSQHQYQPQQQQFKSYQQEGNDHSQGNIAYQYSYHNNHHNNHPNTGNNNQFYSYFPSQNYGNNHNQQRNADNAPKSSSSGLKYQPKYIPQEHSSSADTSQQQQKYQPQGNLVQHLLSDEEEDYQPLYHAQPANSQQQQIPSDTSKVHVSQLKVQLCQRKDKHERKKCQFYHSEEDRRRNPEKYIYSMNLCPNQGGKYSQGDHCSLGDDCPQAHNKVERLYHPLRYKAKFCKDFSERNSCSYGDYCSFAHEDSEIVIPMIDKLTQDAIFFMYFYKTVWCPNISEHVRGDCPYIHNVQDFRRDPKQQKLEPRQCEDWKKDNIKTYQQGRCQKQLDCDHCHGWKELSNHPMVYKTKPCNIPNCNQSNECVLYHSDSDKRVVTPELLAEEETIAASIMNQLFKGKISYDVQLGAPFEAFFSEEELSKNNEHSNNNTNQTSSQQWNNNSSNNNTHGNQGNNQIKNNGAHRIKTQSINGGYYPNKNNNNNHNNLQSNNLQFHNEIPPPSSSYNQHHKHHQRGQQTYLPKTSYLQSQQINVPQAQTSYLPRDQQQQFIKVQEETPGITNSADAKIVERNDVPQLKPTVKASSIITETPNEANSIKPAVPTSAVNSKEFSNFEVITDDSTIASNQTDSNNYFLNQLLLDSPPSSKTTTQEHPIATLNQSRSDNYSLPVSSQKGQVNFLAGVVRQTSDRMVSPVQGLNNKSNLIETINGFNSSNSNIDQVSGYFKQSVHSCSCHFGGASNGQKCQICSGQGLTLIPPFSPHEQIESSHFQEIASAFSQNEFSKTNSERAYSRDSSVSKEDISANTTLNRFNNSHSATPANTSAYSLVSQQQQSQHQGSSSSGIQINKNLQQGSSLINCFNINSPPELSNSRKDSSYTGITTTTPLQTNFDQSENKTKQIDFFVTHGLSEEQIKMMSTSDIENLKFLNAGEKKALSTLADHYEFQDIQNLCNEAAKDDDFQNLD